MDALHPSHETPTSTAAPSGRRLIVDLDRVLLRSSLAAECLVEALRRHPALLLSLPFLLLRGLAYTKAQLARYAELDPSLLPYRQDVVADLRRRAHNGEHLGLISAADVSIAKSVAAHIGIFEPVIASALGNSVTAGRKRQALDRALGPSGYEFLTEGGSAPSLSSLVALMRPPHWIKNILVFLPFLLAHRIGSVHNWLMAVLAFAAFSLCASCTYILNDVLDRHQDRLHPRRRARPVAAVSVTIEWALGSAVLILLVTSLCCAFLPWQCGAVLLWYLMTACFYSAIAKERLMADVIILALLYTSRLLMGSLATGNVVSPWLASFSLMLFLSLALCKRVSELITWRSIQYQRVPGRGYHSEDIPVLEMMAVASGFLACLIMVLYLQSAEILQLYRQPQYLWVGVVGLLYWLGRLIIWTHRGKCPDDPVFFVVQDKTTMLVLALAAGFSLLAI